MKKALINDIKQVMKSQLVFHLDKVQYDYTEQEKYRKKELEKKVFTFVIVL